jgi:hypothetical protein
VKSRFYRKNDRFSDSPEGSKPSNSNEKGSLISSQILAEDMGLELRRLLAQTVEMKGGLSLYSDGM